MLEHIVYNIKQRIVDKGPRMILYSAHDTTLLSLASALNFVNMDCLLQYFYNGVNNSQTCINQYPVFASNFIVELWEQDNLSHSISVPIFIHRFCIMELLEKYPYAEGQPHALLLISSSGLKILSLKIPIKFVEFTKKIPNCTSSQPF